VAFQPTGTANQTIEVRVSFSDERRGLSVRSVDEIVKNVMLGEKVNSAAMTVTFLSEKNMRKLNREKFGKDRSTDVIAFGMKHQGLLVGDVYVCPKVATRNAANAKVDRREELVRLVIHGTLHTLGYDHPEGDERNQSKMWDRQERYMQYGNMGASKPNAG